MDLNSVNITATQVAKNYFSAYLSCNVPKRPPYYAQGFVTCGSPIPNGCCN